MPGFCDERKWNAAVANQLAKIGNRIANLTWEEKHAGMEILTGELISFRGSGVRPAVNEGAGGGGGGGGLLGGRGETGLLRIRGTAPSLIAGGGGGSVSLFEALILLICHLGAAPAAQCAPAGRCDWLQPTLSGHGGRV